MAVTALWRVKGYIGKVLLYAENPEKTSNPEIIQVPKELNRDILEDVIAYAGRDKATNQRQLVWGINCTAENARHEMMAVKRQFRKEKGTVAYHGYQSFKEGEVTPELAHLIGIRLATELWGDRYQVLVATHLDKESHLHNHFVINTVSFVDGIKFHRTQGDYLQMQKKSDEISIASGVGTLIAVKLSDKFSKERTFVNIILYDDIQAMIDLREFLMAHKITNLTTDGYTKD